LRRSHLKVLGKEFEIVSRAISCLTAAEVDYLRMREDPLMDGKDVVGKMVFHRIMEKVAICC
jgi:hypothetical protein